MFGADAPPPPPPAPEPTDETARRRADAERRRRQRGGRATTVRPSREKPGGPQPAETPGQRFGGAFGAGLGVFPGINLR